MSRSAPPRAPRAPGGTRCARALAPFARFVSSDGRDAWARVAFLGLVGGLLPRILPPAVVPALQAIPAWFVLFHALRRGNPWRATGLMLVWSIAVSVVVIGITRLDPPAAAAGILRGAEYRDEMFAWIRTGVGAESDPALFVPQHLRHYSLTMAASFATCGLAGLGFGAVLLNYMNFYVGALVDQARDPVMASLIGWPVWSMLRVAGFVIGAIAAAHLLHGRVLRRGPWDGRVARGMFLASAGLVVADMLVKAWLAPHWCVWLRRALGE